MKRRDFITLLGSGTVAWPLAARAQQGERVRRIGVLAGLSATTSGAVLDKRTFESSLQDLGWTPGPNVNIEYRWSALDTTKARSFAKELLAKPPEVILAIGTSAVTGLIKETKTIPIVFTRVSDPVGQGFVANFAKPGGNVTGFSTLSRRWRGSGCKSSNTLSPTSFASP